MRRFTPGSLPTGTDRAGTLDGLGLGPGAHGPYDTRHPLSHRRLIFGDAEPGSQWENPAAHKALDHLGPNEQVLVVATIEGALLRHHACQNNQRRMTSMHVLQ